jgi:hypothetical protein
MKIVFLNGPPRVGKDTVGKAVARVSGAFETASFAAELKDATHRAFGLDVPTNHFELNKDEPQLRFFGKTPRQVYIAFSENFMKPLYGDEVFGKFLVETLAGMEQAGVELVAITDSGFLHEARQVLRTYPEALLIRLHRQGCNFSNDSRGYIYLPEIAQVDLHNEEANDPRIIANFIDNWFREPKEVS